MPKIQRRHFPGAWRLAAAAALQAVSLAARDLHVHAAHGADSADGTAAAPVATLRRAVALARPGDTIHLAPRGAVFREMLRPNAHQSHEKLTLSATIARGNDSRRVLHRPVTGGLALRSRGYTVR